MVKKFNPYQVICIGDDCKLYGKCDKDCLLKPKFKKYLKGCNYSKEGDCKYCSHKRTCEMIKPYSPELHEVELKRKTLERENKELYTYISTWNEIENDLESYDAESVFDVVHFKRSKQKMVDRIKDNEKLINAYLKKEERLLEDM